MLGTAATEVRTRISATAQLRGVRERYVRTWFARGHANRPDLAGRIHPNRRDLLESWAPADHFCLA
jgi:hypothetical protein